MNAQQFIRKLIYDSWRESNDFILQQVQEARESLVEIFVKVANLADDRMKRRSVNFRVSFAASIFRHFDSTNGDVWYG